MSTYCDKYSIRFLIELSRQNGRYSYSCQEQETLVPDDSLQIMKIEGADVIAEKPTICNVPSLYVNFYCEAWLNSEKDPSKVLDGTAMNKAEKDLIADVERNIPGSRKSFANCVDIGLYEANFKKFYEKNAIRKKLKDDATEFDSERNIKNGYADEYGTIFQLGIPGLPFNGDRFWVRQHLFNLGTVKEDPAATVGPSGYVGPSWDWIRLKKATKAIFLPYVHGNNGYLYNCAGEEIGK